ncbi:hypothetical protein MYRA21_3340 [Myroides sp. A21]|uniref:hypothetical protein n=1 Tax=Myroides sp. A21 TaxID=1583100 RepID=UPI00057EAF74|nr:hypothetical protein [Myroides sp. A21]AJA70433.1 hypothetical protein MYRA21_3340 [Myroides sp. A21]
MRKFSLMLFLMGISVTGYAQVGIGVQKPTSASMLEVHSPDGNKGVLLPKVALTDKNVFAPINGDKNDPRHIGLVIFNQTTNPTKDLVSGYYYWTGTNWTSFVDKQEILNVIEEKQIGGNVYYGKIGAGKEQVLYVKSKDENGKEIIEELNLLPGLIDNITNASEEVVFELKDKLGYNISEKVSYIGKSIKGNYIYSFYTTTSLESDNAEAKGVSLNKSVLELLSKGEVFKIMLLDSNYKLIDISVTDIEVSQEGVLKFSLGTPNFYLTLPQGQYGMIVELISTKKI